MLKWVSYMCGWFPSILTWDALIFGGFPSISKWVQYMCGGFPSVLIEFHKCMVGSLAFLNYGFPKFVVSCLASLIWFP